MPTERVIHAEQLRSQGRCHECGEHLLEGLGVDEDLGVHNECLRRLMCGEDDEDPWQAEDRARWGRR